MKTLKRIILLFLVSIVVANAYALTIGYPVVVENLVKDPVVIELSQYHAPGFKGRRPADFTDDLLNSRTQITLAPGEKREIKYTSAGGGHWLLWRVISPSEHSSQSGVLQLYDRELSIKIE